MQNKEQIRALLHTQVDCYIDTASLDDFVNPSTEIEALTDYRDFLNELLPILLETPETPIDNK